MPLRLDDAVVYGPAPPGHGAALPRTEAWAPPALPRSWAVAVVEDLVERAPAVGRELGDEPAHLLLPRGLRGDGALLVDAIPEEFTMIAADGAVGPRTLAAVIAGDEPSDVLDRLELARLVVRATEALHSQGMVSSGITAECFACVVRPRPQVLWLSAHAVRGIGGEFLGPGARDPETDSTDRDRRDVARLVAALLGIAGDAALPGFSEAERLRLHELYGRMDEIGARAPMWQWREALKA